MDSLIVECSAAFPSSVLVKVLPSLQDSPGYFCKQTSPVKNPRKDPQLWAQTEGKKQPDIKDHKSFPTYFPYLSRITMDQHSGTLVPGTLLIPKSRRKNRPNHRPSDQPMGDFP